MPHPAVTATNRFGLGARPGELAAARSDPQAWLSAQIAGSRPLPPEIKALPSSAEVFAVYAEGIDERRDARKKAESEAEQAKRVVANIRQKLAPLYLDQVAARYRVATATDLPFRERLVHFWANHFAVSADKPQVIALAGTLENEAIRPNVGRRFVDLLLAVESHPAMILYLDNQASIGPNSKLASRAARRTSRSGRKLDINENLAREILELHTLGVGSGPGMLKEGKPCEFEFREKVSQPARAAVSAVNP